MRKLRARVVVGATLLAAACACAGESDLMLLITKLRAGDAAAKQQLIAAGVPAIPDLFGLSADQDARVAWEARSALRRIALRAADGTPEQRKAVFDAVLPWLDPQKPVAARRAVIEMLGLVGDGSVDQVRPLALIALREEALADQALDAISRMGAGGLGALTCIAWHDGQHVISPPGDAELGPMKPAVKARALELLASHPIEDSGRPDVTLSFLRDMARSPDERVRVAAMKAFAAWGHPDGEPILIEALKPGKGAVPDAAFDALLAVAAAREEPAAASVALDRALMLAKTDEQQARALAALGRMGDPASLPSVAAALQSKPPAVRSAACTALCRLRGPAALQAMVEALATAPSDLKPRLAEAIGARRDPAAAKALAASARDKDETVALAAVRALEALADPATAGDLLALAASDGAPKPVKTAALRAAIGLGDLLADRGQGPAAQAVLERALGLATTDAERRQAVHGMGKAADPKAAALLAPIVASSQGALRAAAVEACLATGDAAAVRGDHEAAIDAFAAVAGTDAPEASEAVKKLATLGVHYGLAQRGGFITTWWTIGPFPCGNVKEAEKKAWLPEDSPDIRKAVREGNSTLRWRLEDYRHPKGWVVLKGRLKPDDKVAAYCYTVLASEAERDVRLLLGRDDGLTLWLNGEQLYNAHDASGIDTAEFAVAAHLVKGINRILVKSSQGGADWQFYVKLAEAEKKP